MFKSYGYATRNKNGNFEVFFTLDNLFFNKKEQVFELTPIGWKSKTGHKVKIELIDKVIDLHVLGYNLSKERTPLALIGVKNDVNYLEVSR